MSDLYVCAVQGARLDVVGVVFLGELLGLVLLDRSEVTKIHLVADQGYDGLGVRVSTSFLQEDGNNIGLRHFTASSVNQRK